MLLFNTKEKMLLYAQPMFICMKPAIFDVDMSQVALKKKRIKNIIIHKEHTQRINSKTSDLLNYITTSGYLSLLVFLLEDFHDLDLTDNVVQALPVQCMTYHTVGICNSLVVLNLILSTYNL